MDGTILSRFYFCDLQSTKQSKTKQKQKSINVTGIPNKMQQADAAVSNELHVWRVIEMVTKRSACIVRN